MCGCLHVPPTEDLACNPGMCPDWESNQQHFGSEAQILEERRRKAEKWQTYFGGAFV